jgi:hydrogenase/urease accessory protein HupE
MIPRLFLFLALAGLASAHEAKVEPVGGFPEFLVQGIHHIFIGPDHICFILGLLLLGGTLGRLLKVATVFTLAHSITLGAATLGFITLPGKIVEPIIALSVVAAGLMALFHPEPKKWQIPFAFGFGLIHGFGFAGALGGLELPQSSLGLCLGGFNLGVELGQLAIVLVAAPLLMALQRYAPRLSSYALPAIALGIAASGWLWFFERVR